MTNRIRIELERWPEQSFALHPDLLHTEAEDQALKELLRLAEAEFRASVRALDEAICKAAVDLHRARESR
jgi:hypothetical protein